MIKMTGRRAVAAVTVAAAAMVGLGGVTTAVLASPTPGPLSVTTCPSGYHGVIVVVNGKDNAVCENFV